MTKTQSIILGYIVFIVYMPLMFVMGQILGKKTNLNKETVSGETVLK